MKKEDIIRLHGIEYYEEYKRRNCERIKNKYRTDDEYRKQRSINISRCICKRYKEDPEFKLKSDLNSKAVCKRRYREDPEYNAKCRNASTVATRRSYVMNRRIDLIENYDKAKADNFKGWDIHHRDEIRILPSGMIVTRTREELIENDRYYNCPPNELIWIRTSEHMRLHRRIRSYFQSEGIWASSAEPVELLRPQLRKQ